VTHGGFGSSSAHERDPHSLLFGPDEHDPGTDVGTEPRFEPQAAPGRPPQAGRGRARSAATARGGHRRGGRRGVVLGMTLALLAVVGVVVWRFGPPIYHYFSPEDYSGAGYGSVTVEVQPNDGARAIGAELHRKGVVASTAAFVDAASANKNSADIQPGTYSLPKHIPAKVALADLLDGKHKARGLLVPEGATVVDVEKRLVAPRCTAASPANAAWTSPMRRRARPCVMSPRWGCPATTTAPAGRRRSRPRDSCTRSRTRSAAGRRRPTRCSRWWPRSSTRCVRVASPPMRGHCTSRRTRR
jgi:hypothetical protein